MAFQMKPVLACFFVFVSFVSSEAKVFERLLQTGGASEVNQILNDFEIPIPIEPPVEQTFSTFTIKLTSILCNSFSITSLEFTGNELSSQEYQILGGVLGISFSCDAPVATRNGNLFVIGSRDRNGNFVASSTSTKIQFQIDFQSTDFEVFAPLQAEGSGTCDQLIDINVDYDLSNVKFAGFFGGGDILLSGIDTIAGNVITNLIRDQTENLVEPLACELLTNLTDAITTAANNEDLVEIISSRQVQSESLSDMAIVAEGEMALPDGVELYNQTKFDAVVEAWGKSIAESPLFADVITSMSANPELTTIISDIEGVLSDIEGVLSDIEGVVSGIKNVSIPSPIDVITELGIQLGFLDSLEGDISGNVSSLISDLLGLLNNITVSDLAGALPEDSPLNDFFNQTDNPVDYSVLDIIQDQIIPELRNISLSDIVTFLGNPEIELLSGFINFNSTLPELFVEAISLINELSCVENCTIGDLNVTSNSSCTQLGPFNSCDLESPILGLFEQFLDTELDLLGFGTISLLPVGFDITSQNISILNAHRIGQSSFALPGFALKDFEVSIDLFVGLNFTAISEMTFNDTITVGVQVDFDAQIALLSAFAFNSLNLFDFSGLSTPDDILPVFTDFIGCTTSSVYLTPSGVKNSASVQINLGSTEDTLIGFFLDCLDTILYLYRSLFPTFIEDPIRTLLDQSKANGLRPLNDDGTCVRSSRDDEDEDEDDNDQGENEQLLIAAIIGGIVGIVGLVGGVAFATVKFGWCGASTATQVAEVKTVSL